MNLVKKTIFLMLLASCIIQLTIAQQKNEWKEAKSGGYTYKYISNDPMQARFYTLKNGLTVILSVNKKDPRIQTLIGTRAGSNNDPKDHTGLAHYLEHLLFKGTEQYGSLDWAREKPYLDKIEGLYDTYNHTSDATARKTIYHQIDSVSGLAAKYAIANEYDKMMTGMGAQGTNAHTWVEETIYEEDIPSNAIDKYLSVQSERFKDPVFRLFHTELEAVYEEKNRGLDNDSRKSYELMLSSLFPTHNYGQQSTIGTVEHLKNPSLKAIRKFYNEYYVPNNMAIVMAGDFNPDYVIKKIDDDFAYMKSKPVPEYKAPVEVPIKAPIVKEVVGPDAENVMIAYRMPGALDTKSSVVLGVVSEIMNNGKAGLLDLNINKAQKVLSASAGVMGWKDYAVFQLSGKPKQGQTLDQVKDLLLGQLEILKKGQFDETLVKAIVNNAKLSELQGLENNNNRASSLMDGFIKHRGQNWQADVSYVDNMGKVTKQQIVDFANKYFDNNYVLIYKRKGEDKNIEKVEKPTITPVAINRNDQSAFLKKVDAMPATQVQPQWLDFDKDIQKGKAGQADVLYVQNKDNGLFRLYYRFDMGAWNNKMLPLAAQYLQFLSTDKYTSEQISREFYNIACSFTLSSGNENSVIAISGLQENFDKAVALFEHLLTHCQVNEEALAALKGRIAKSRTDNKLNKGNIMKGLANYAMYGAKNPFNNALSQADLDGVTASQLTDMLHTFGNYKHTVIYYGPQSMNDMIAAVQKEHVIPATWKEAAPQQKFEKIDQAKNQVLFANYDMVQTEVNWVRNSVVYNPDNTALVSMFNGYFGGGMGSIVFQTIRESKALAYSTYAFYSSPDKKGARYSTVAYVGSQADKMNDAINGMNELLNDIPRSDKLFETARQSLKQDIETERITQDGIIFTYLADQKLGLQEDNRKKVYEKIDKITFDDVKKFHDEELAKKPYTYCVVASDKRVSMDDLKKFGDVKVLTLEEIFGY
ncbi:insulinase family protein [Chitinophaga sancti]|uniref:Insulinase family protein n=1 Tax=Chitinophaga sancti TaxID=1004 RepID=A0A1K1RHP9_9BACT|nr:insulinase family protein [Chitinophaga sancti]WQD60613.1 insulinase family protein [Chitinophaga sancti]WQG87259.1 insulinase family protein [Chitinophaga sancti]SFW71457.1 Predicted Zn-dependent peptidase [Chitinophaga sancti]